MGADKYFVVAAEVEKAVKRSDPVVALETAVLTHGLPKDASLAAYLEMMKAVEDAGALPVPVGMVGGRLKVGLTREELKALDADAGAGKASLQTLPFLAAAVANGGTTAGATLMAARRAGVSLLATGGIGGAHKGVERTFDVSNDLHALAEYGGAVVCSGAKSLCDLPKTLEMLETLGVPVVGYQTSELPAFTNLSSGLKLSRRVENAQEAAALIQARDGLMLKQAILFANPPPEGDALPETLAREALAAALEKAEEGKISGPELTPWLLAEVEKATAGRSVKANLALLTANAELAGYIAVRCAWAKVPA